MDEAIARAKRSLRQEMAAKRSCVDAEFRAAAGAAIAASIFALPEFEAASRVVAYVARPDEAPLDAVLHRVLNGGRCLLVPRIEAERLAFVAVEDLTTLQPNAFGVCEPSHGRPSSVLERGDLILVPGLAFDRSGARLGRGGGHYDRSLPPDLAVFGVAYSFQLVEVVPAAPFDRKTEGVVTELGVIRVGVRDHAGDAG